MRNRAAEGASQLQKAADKQVDPEMRGHFQRVADTYQAADTFLSGATTADEIALGNQLLRDADSGAEMLGYEPPPR